MTLLEVCVDTLEGARAAARAGAHRLELCSRLDLDGLSPARDVLGAALEELALPLHAMVRPRPGDFVVRDGELEAMEREARDFVRAGAAGLVLGCLLPSGEVDRASTARLVEAADGRPVTFHRAFDLVPDPLGALEVLVDLGVARVLTSGGAPDAWSGHETLRALVERAADRIVVLAGGGVRAHNARALVDATGVAEVHGSVPFDPGLLQRRT